jgi:hypothetical protein
MNPGFQAGSFQPSFQQVSQVIVPPVFFSAWQREFTLGRNPAPLLGGRFNFGRGPKPPLGGRFPFLP